MGMYVISDNEQEKSVIADDETGRCYGYITSGPGHRELLLAFLDGLGTHVAAYEPHELSSLWEGFTDIAKELNDSLLETAADDTNTTRPEGESESGNASEALPDNDDGSGSAEGTSETGETAEETNPLGSSTASSRESEMSHGTLETPQKMPCFNCSGSGTAPVTGGKCGVCDGTGEIVHTPTDAVTG